MTPLWLKLVLLGGVGVVTVGWWLLVAFTQMMSPTGYMPRSHKVVGWVLLGVVTALAWWVFS